MQLYSFFLLLLGAALVRASEPGQCDCAERVNTCSVVGLPGIPGNPGLPGRDGMPGLKGEEGPQALPGLRGSQGIPGKAGPSGAKGDQGEKGQRGDSGSSGSQGPQGIPGKAGPSGAKGDQGEKGRRGDSGSSELELLKAQINDLQAQLKVLHGTAERSQKLILNQVFPTNIQVGQKLFVTKGAEGNYEASKAACVHLGGQTASPRNSAENNALTKIAAKLGKNLFLGMNDRETEGAFQHLNGERMQYSNWAAGEPNGVDEDCIEMFTDGQWNDNSCSDNRLIVCELPSI